jgi:hypothetical protein
LWTDQLKSPVLPGFFVACFGDDISVRIDQNKKKQAVQPAFQIVRIKTSFLS